MDKCDTGEQAEKSISQSASSFSGGEGAAEPAKLRCSLLAHGMYHSTCIGKSLTSLACPLVANVTLSSSEAVLPCGKEPLSSAPLPKAQYQEEQRNTRARNTVN